MVYEVKSVKCGNVMVEVLATGGQTTYLGRSINLTDMDDTELQSRMAKAWAKFGVFRSELTDRAIPMHLRARLFDAVITPTILYGNETWTMKRQRQLSLRAVQRRMMRRLIHAHRSYDRYDSYVDWIKEESQSGTNHCRPQHHLLDGASKKKVVKVGREDGQQKQRQMEPCC